MENCQNYCLDLSHSNHPSSLSQPLVKQDSLDTYNERDPFKNDDARDEEEDPEDTDSGIEGEVDPLDRDVIIQPPPPPPPLRPPTERVNFPKGLPWAPKVRLTAQFFCFGFSFQQQLRHFLTIKGCGFVSKVR